MVMAEKAMVLLLQPATQNRQIILLPKYKVNQTDLYSGKFLKAGIQCHHLNKHLLKPNDGSL
jgi:hypothetical protein